MIVEVFKTNVEHQNYANILLEHIVKAFPYYKANFDLEDCDKILRIESKTEKIEPSFIIDILGSFGFDAEILPDIVEQVVNGDMR